LASARHGEDLEKYLRDRGTPASRFHPKAMYHDVLRNFEIDPPISGCQNE
jgi:hypothetical protein